MRWFNKVSMWISAIVMQAFVVYPTMDAESMQGAYEDGTFFWKLLFVVATMFVTRGAALVKVPPAKPKPPKPQ